MCLDSGTGQLATAQAKLSSPKAQLSKYSGITHKTLKNHARPLVTIYSNRLAQVMYSNYTKVSKSILNQSRGSV